MVTKTIYIVGEILNMVVLYTVVTIYAVTEDDANKQIMAYATEAKRANKFVFQNLPKNYLIWHDNGSFSFMGDSNESINY